MRAIFFLFFLGACSFQQYKDTVNCATYPHESEKYCHEWWNDGSTFGDKAK